MSTVMDVDGVEGVDERCVVTYIADIQTGQGITMVEQNTTESSEASVAQAKEDLQRVFAGNLKYLMLKKRMSQMDLHRASGVGKQSISDYVNGRGLPGQRMLHLLSVALRVKPNDLLPGAEDTTERPAASPDIRATTPLKRPAARVSSPEMKVLSNDPTFARISLNEVVHTTTAIEIMRLLAADAAELSNDNDLAD